MIQLIMMDTLTFNVIGIIEGDYTFYKISLDGYTGELAFKQGHSAIYPADPKRFDSLEIERLKAENAELKAKATATA